jgi:hypothetical protein
MNLNVDLGKLLKGKKKLGDSDKVAAGKVPSAAVKIDHPRVDLLPERFRQRATDRTVRQGSFAAVIATTVLVAGTWGAAALAGGAAQERLDDAKLVEQSLNADMAVYSPVTNLAEQTRSLTTTIEQQAAQSVDHDLVLNRFLAAATGRIDITSVQVDTSGAGACVSTDPFATQTDLVGCISFTGAPTDVSGLLAALEGDDWFVGPYVPSVGDGDSVSGTVGLGELVRTQATDDGLEEAAALDAADAAEAAADTQTNEPLEITLGEQDGDQGR